MGSELLALSVLAFALTYLIHSTILLVLARLLAGALPPRLVRLRERVWRVALFGGIVTAGLQLALGLQTPFAHWALCAEAAPAEVARTLELSALPLPFFTPDAGAAPTLAVPRVRAAGEGAPAVVPAHLVPGGAPEAARAPVAGARSPRLAEWLALAWLLAAAVVLAFLAVLVVRLRRTLAGRRVLDSGPLPVALERLTRRAGIRFPIRLYLAPRLTAPISVGWLRPAICVPPRAVTDLAPEEQQAMLAHELAHLWRRDPSWMFLYWLVESAFFFQPLNRLARRHLLDSAEILCDDWAVRQTGRHVSLASCLARIAEWIVHRPRPMLAAHMAQGLPATTSRARSRLGRRIERLLEERHSQEPARPWLLPLALGLLASLAVAAPGVAAVAAQEPEPLPEPVPAPEPPPEPVPEPAPPLLRAPAPEPRPAAVPVPEPVPMPAPLPIQPGELTPAPAPAAAPLPAARPLERDLSALDEEVRGLERELSALRCELSERALSPRIEAALAEIEARARALGERRDEIRSLVQRAASGALLP